MHIPKRKTEQYKKLVARLNADNPKNNKKRLSTLHRYERSLLTSGLLTGSLLFCGGTIVAQPDFNDEVIVNSQTSGSQIRPSMDMDADGDFVVVWDDADENFIKAQLYNEQGTPIGGEITVSENTSTYEVDNPSVDMDDDGNFVVVWMQENNSDTNIYARKFDSAGSAESSFKVNSTDGNHRKPDVVLLENGEFITTWFQNQGTYRINYKNSDCPFEYVVYDGSTSYQPQGPNIDADDIGNFVIVWGFKNDTQVNAYLYNGSTACVSGVYNSYTVAGANPSEDVRRSEVAMDEDGNFVVVWEKEYSGNSATYFSIQAQRFSNAGSAVGGVITVTETSSFMDMPRHPSVAMLEDDGFVVAWQDGFSYYFDDLVRSQVITRDADGTGIQAQVYDGMGNPVGPVIDINQYETDDQARPNVGSDDQGNFNVAWESQGADDDASAIAVRAALPPSTAPIPTLSQWGMIILGLFSSIFGIVGLQSLSRRLQPQAATEEIE